jgi:chromate reductase, NAD(P)H dehydrogenase (quinone)
MNRILAFSGSNSSRSINQKLIKYAANLVEKSEVTLLDLKDYSLPMFDLDCEEKYGIPDKAYELKTIFDVHDAFIIAIPEHNSSMPSFFKNIIDWLSRIEKSVFRGKSMILLSATPGPSGGHNVLPEVEKVVSGYLTGQVIGKLGFPKFFRLFQAIEGNMENKDLSLENELKELIQLMEQKLLDEKEIKIARRT